MYMHIHETLPTATFSQPTINTFTFSPCFMALNMGFDTYQFKTVFCANVRKADWMVKAVTGCPAT